MFGELPAARIPWLLPLAGVCLRVDALGGFFMAITGAVVAVVGVYWIGYAHRERLARTALIVLPAFAAALLLVTAAGSVTTFLYGWELMAIASLVLLLIDHRRDQVRSAAVVYAVMTQSGFVALLLGMMVLAAAAHTDVFTEIGSIPEPARTVVFLLTFAGFGSKAGLLPLHAWLPRAHPEAPSAVSALMSAAMVNLGVYGILRVDLQLLGPAPRWWGMLLMVVGGASAIYGVLQASVATDLKRLLAYSTTENMGLIVLAVGVATLMSASGVASAAAIAMTAALLHLIAHAAFKSLGFLASGSVLAATGLRDLNRLGGLVRRMPLTTALFGVSALGAAGLPLGAGFVSEWLLVQSLIHTGTNRDAVVALATPLTVAAVALTAGLGVATMAKAFGIGFLARPRSDAAAHAEEAPATMVTAMAVAATGCTVLAVAPGAVAAPIGRVFDVLPSVGALDRTDLGLLLRLPGVAGSMGPGLLAAALGGAAVAVLIVARWRSSRRPEPVTLPLWACGADDLSSRMQYTATSFAQPLQRVFHDVLRPDTDVAVTHVADSRYLVERIEYRVTATDVVEDRLHRPVLRVVAESARLIRAAHNGSVHLYLTYGAVGVLIVLLVAAR
ncbi:hypothetical protein KIH27_18285 [Mycobacterium sp. M1]|uniref:NADH:quinone oxidoreductase/Mrp antiporter transmembrane domain-containing protein n=2 Tax=Mycolicibacter acidiphilus TaxID=2835306 RepID=A0ABS5RPQ1_9MYCO|nr:proton-conducting transporter membrane subunit [Mycolicibacter acidiphilus]MBS9535538.1 hypothetical protein [Mycolicibacter acidiphilus]